MCSSACILHDVHPLNPPVATGASSICSLDTTGWQNSPVFVLKVDTLTVVDVSTGGAFGWPTRHKALKVVGVLNDDNFDKAAPWCDWGGCLVMVEVPWCNGDPGCLILLVACVTVASGLFVEAAQWGWLVLVEVPICEGGPGCLLLLVVCVTAPSDLRCAVPVVETVLFVSLDESDDWKS